MFAAVVGQAWAVLAHPYNLEVNGIDRIASVDYASIRVEMAGPGTNGMMSFDLEDPTASITVAAWDEVRFIEHAATPRPIVFGGFVQSVRYRAWAAAGRTISVSAVGYGVLLDKKAVPPQPTFVKIAEADSFRGYDTAMSVQRLVNLYGGRMSAVEAGSDIAAWVPPNESAGIAYSGLRWSLDVFFGATDPVIPAPSYLREAVEFLLSISFSMLDSDTSTGVYVPLPGLYWVDSACMFRLLPDGSVTSWTAPGGGGDPYPIQWDGGATGFAFDDSGTYVVEDVEYDEDDQDRATSAYVQGANANGTGFARTFVGLPRAGDLEVIVSDDNSTVAGDIPTRGAGAVARTTGATIRGTITVSATSPLALWPGRYMTVDQPQVGLQSSMIWRALGVRIAWRSSTSRTYEVTFGTGNAAQANIVRRRIAGHKRRGQVH